MIILEADNRRLTLASKYSYLVNNYASGVSQITILNATDSDFGTGTFLLLGNFGSESTEVVQITTMNADTGVINLASSTKFPHGESTKVSVLPYNQIRFFHTTTTTFDVLNPLTGYVDIQASDWFTTFGDESNSTGFGWFTFYNSETAVSSQPSNAIPYTGFESSTTENILNDFFSMLSNKELKLITREDALTWASEGYGRMRNKLNLTNVEYTGSTVTSLSIQEGVIEYDLPSDFDHLLFFVSGLNANDLGATGGQKMDIDFIPLREAYTYKGSRTRYYIRGSKIGILPTPATDTTYHYMYQKRAARLELNTDEVDLPNGGEYVIKDWMLYRAFQKFQNPLFKQYLESFTAGLNDMIISSVSRDANLDTWGIDRSANV